MTECDEQLLGAYHDGELTAADRQRVEQHLAQCADCTAELERLRQATKLLSEYPFQDITTDELSRLHQAIDDEAGAGEDQEDQVVWRIGGTMGLIAASILVVGFAWLRTLPPASSVTGQRPTEISNRAAAPAWERMAVQLRDDPFSSQANPDDVRMAELDWMAYQLKTGRTGR